jgi:hypothetical protein
VEAYLNSETAPAEVKERKGKIVRIVALGKLKAYWMEHSMSIALVIFISMSKWAACALVIFIRMLYNGLSLVFAMMTVTIRPY